jgi:hypothetical protein
MTTNPPGDGRGGTWKERHLKNPLFYIVAFFALSGVFNVISGSASIPSGEGKDAKPREAAGWEARLWGAAKLLPAVVYWRYSRRPEDEEERRRKNRPTR